MILVWALSVYVVMQGTIQLRYGCFSTTIQEIAKEAGKTYGAEEKADIAMRVIVIARAISSLLQMTASFQHRSRLCDS